MDNFWACPVFFCIDLINGFELYFVSAIAPLDRNRTVVWNLLRMPRMGTSSKKDSKNSSIERPSSCCQHALVIEIALFRDQNWWAWESWAQILNCISSSLLHSLEACEKVYTAFHGWKFSLVFDGFFFPFEKIIFLKLESYLK